MESPDNVLKRNEEIAWRVIDGEALLVDPKDSRIYPLNTVGTAIWELLDGRKRCGDIAAAISEEFEADESAIQKDVRKFLEDMVEKGLVKRH